MPAVDFDSWAAPDLTLTLGGRVYTVRPPSVEDAKKILAAAVRGEVRLGLVKGEIPAEVRRVLKTIQPGEHPALGDAWEQMRADGVPAATIDRVAYYAVFFWARGKQYADTLAEALWAPRAETAAEGGGSPKAPPTSPRKSGRSTGSGKSSTMTETASQSSRTIASLKK